MSDLTSEQLDGMDMWNRDVMLDERHRAAGSMLVRMAVAEIRRHRAMVKRLEEFALSLEYAHHPDMRTVGDLLRNRMRSP